MLTEHFFLDRQPEKWLIHVTSYTSAFYWDAAQLRTHPWREHLLVIFCSIYSHFTDTYMLPLYKKPRHTDTHMTHYLDIFCSTGSHINTGILPCRVEEGCDEICPDLF